MLRTGAFAGRVEATRPFTKASETGTTALIRAPVRSRNRVVVRWRRISFSILSSAFCIDTHAPRQEVVMPAPHVMIVLALTALLHQSPAQTQHQHETGHPPERLGTVS